MEILSQKCPKCGRQIEGLTQGQLSYNFELHLGSHTRKEKKRK